MTVNITRRNKPEDEVEERFITGLRSLDWAFVDNVGHIGLPLRSITELTGAQGIGKSTLMFSLAGMVAAELKRGITLIDFERQNEETLTSCLELAGFSGEVDWATYIWNDKKKKTEAEKKAESSETILNLSTKKAYEPNPDIIMIDSMAAFTPTAIHEGDLEDANMGIYAKTVKTWFRRTLKPVLSNPSTGIVFFTNHLHPVIGAWKPSVNSPTPMESAGGVAVGYLATQSIDLVKLRGFDFIESNGWVLEGRIAKNRDGAGLFGKKKFYVYLQGGEGINKNMTAVIDCLMYQLAKSSATASSDSASVILDGQNMGKFRDLIASRHKNEIFLPFHNSLKSVVGGIKEVSTTLGEQ